MTRSCVLTTSRRPFYPGWYLPKFGSSKLPWSYLTFNTSLVFFFFHHQLSRFPSLIPFVRLSLRLYIFAFLFQILIQFYLYFILFLFLSNYCKRILTLWLLRVVPFVICTLRPCLPSFNSHTWSIIIKCVTLYFLLFFHILIFLMAFIYIYTNN